MTVAELPFRLKRQSEALSWSMPSASSAAMRLSILNVFRSNVTMDRSSLEVAEAVPCAPWMPMTPPTSLPLSFVDDQNAVFPGDEKTKTGRIEDDVIPAVVANVSVGETIGTGCGEGHGGEGTERKRLLHRNSPSAVTAAWRMNLGIQ